MPRKNALYEGHGFSRAVKSHSNEGFTSAAKAAPAQDIYGTAEAVPFVQSVFPQPA
jgi:hypothetical protein